MNPLQQLESCGQSPWLDNLSRGLIVNGGLKKLIEQDGVKGLTSNPSIFEKSIVGSDEYTQSLESFQALGDHSVNAIYEHLVIADIQSGGRCVPRRLREDEGARRIRQPRMLSLSCE